MYLGLPGALGWFSIDWASKKNPGGLNLSSGARSWRGFVSIGQVGQKSEPQKNVFF